MKYPGTKPHSALPVKLLHQPEDQGVVTLGVPGFRQVRNYSCGYTAALMVLRHFGSAVAGEELYKALGTTRDGTGQSAIIKVLRDQGLRAGVRYDMDFAAMRRCIDVGKVLIGYLADEHHWLVLYGYGQKPPRIFVADPEPGKACEHRWEGYGERLGGFAIVCSPKLAPRSASMSTPRSGLEYAPESAAPKEGPSTKEEAASRSLADDTDLKQLTFDFVSGS